MNIPVETRILPIQWLWLFLCLLAFLVLFGAGLLYIRNGFHEARSDALKDMGTIGDLKAGQILQWRNERLRDAHRSAIAPFFRRELLEAHGQVESGDFVDMMRTRLILERDAGNYADVLLLDADGSVSINAADDEKPVDAATLETIAQLEDGEGARLSDLFICPLAGQVYIDAVAPVLDDSQTPIAYIVLRSAARDYFNELLQFWPGLSETAETVLVRREGGEVVFLNPLRHRDAAPFSVRLPISESSAAAVQAVLGAEGVHDGTDYRHERVLTSLHPIPGSSWYMVAKIDATEAYAEARFRAIATGLLMGVGMLFLAGALLYADRERKATVYKGRYEAEMLARKTLEEFRTTLYSIGDAVITTDTESRIHRMNPVAESLTGWTEAEATGKPLREVFRIIDETTGDAAACPVETVKANGGIVELPDFTKLVDRAGNERPIADSGAPILDDDGKLAGVVIVFRDQSEERAAQEALRESESRFRFLYENAAIGILIHDAETGEILDANRKAISDYGLETLEELQSRDIWLDPPYSLDDALRIIRKAVTHGPQRHEWKNRDIHGNEFWEDVTTFTMPMDGHLRVVTVAQDINQRKRVEAALVQSTTEIERFFSLSLDLLCIADTGTGFIKLNSAWETVLGYPIDELLGVSYMNFIHPDDHEKTLQITSGLANMIPVDGFVNRYLTVDGDIRYIEWRATSPDGHFIYAAARDITARKHAEEERTRLMMLLAEAETIASLGAWELEVDTGRTTWTKEVFALHEMLPEESLSVERAVSFYHPEDQPIVAEAVRKAIEEGEPYELTARFFTATGNFRWVRTSGKPILEDGKARRIVGMFQDITAQRLGEEALERELAFSQQLIAAMTDGFVITDANGVTLDVNPAFTTMTGFSSDELIGERPPNRYWPPEDIGEIQAAFDETLALSARTHALNFMRKNGERFPVLVSPSFILDADNKATNYFATVKDMSERVRANEERERLLSAIEQSSESILITDIRGDIQYVNPAFERITGYSRAEAMGKNPSILKSGEQSTAYYRQLWETIIKGETWHGRLRNKRKDGSLYTEDATISPVRDRNGDIVSFVAVKRDIGREEELESQLRQAQKMDAVGRLAGGIAHDFNNMLGVILGHTEMALESVPEDETLYEDLEQIQMAGRRSAELTRQLLSFARKQTITPKVLDLNAAIGELLGMLTRLIGENIEIAWEPGEHLPPVKMDPAQIDQILVNLTVNARDAMETGGRITIATRTENFTREEDLTIPGMPPGAYALLTVSDTGCGMEEGTLEHIFEPFFSTKEMGRGTGLGLATVYGIVKQNEGYINVDSALGKGAVFQIYLPAQPVPSAGAVGESAASAARDVGHESILLVEDEAPLLAVSKRFLERLGYTVLAAATPLAALSIAEDQDQTIDLLLTDVVMPEMTGREVWERLHKVRPDMRCLFVSGYTADIIATHGVVDETVYFLQKPFSMHALAAKVRETLDSAPPIDASSTA